ncbi:hypothetical protein [Paraburkholderia sp. MM6662-R1]|uniref:hypothetical protein n=1 Tax=Paraburkholderia sp. MM6662-R1 TaxID=2991066 RepID=UPI003D2156DF
MIVYVGFSVDMHRLQLRSMEEVEALRVKLDAVVRAHVYPGPVDFDTDIEVDLLILAGSPQEVQ